MRFRIVFLLIITAFIIPFGSLHAADFEQTLELEGITFKVHATNKGSINTLTIKPKGLKVDNRPIVREVNGTVVEAEVADLNEDGAPEILVYTTSAGSGSYGNVIGYASNAKKSLAPITMPDLMEDKDVYTGYKGHDEFSIVETRLARRFPVYQSGDTNNQPTGGFRLLYYGLERLESKWFFKLDEVVNLRPDDLASQ
mgnify:CR=1 FL=1